MRKYVIAILPVTNVDKEYHMQITPIELIGHAKNNIVESKELLNTLPAELNLKLSCAYELLNDARIFI